MTWLDVLPYGPGWLACLLIPLWWMDHRFRRQYKERWGVNYNKP